MGRQGEVGGEATDFLRGCFDDEGSVLVYTDQITLERTIQTKHTSTSKSISRSFQRANSSNGSGRLLIGWRATPEGTGRGSDGYTIRTLKSVGRKQYGAGVEKCKLGGLKSRCPQGLAGSNPASGTTPHFLTRE